MGKIKIIKTGALVSFCIIILIWGISFLQGKNMLYSYNQYFAVFNKINGLKVSSQIVINGFKVGQVRDIQLLNDFSGNLLVELSVKKEIKIPKNSSVKIADVNLFGIKKVNIVFCKSNDFYKNKDTLISINEDDIQENVKKQVLPLARRVEKFLISSDTLLIAAKNLLSLENQEKIIESLNRLNNSLKYIESSSKNINQIIKKERNHIENIFANTDSLTSVLNKNSTNISLIINNLVNISDSLKYLKFKENAIKINQLLTQMNDIGWALKKQKGIAGKVLYNDTLYRNIEQATVGLNKLLIDMHKRPKRYFHFSLLGIGGKNIKIEKTKDTVKINSK